MPDDMNMSGDQGPASVAGVVAPPLAQSSNELLVSL